MATKKHVKEGTGRRIAPLSTLSANELRALVKLAVSRKVLIPSPQSQRVYHSLWRKGYTLWVAAVHGYILNLDRMDGILDAIGLRK